MSITADDYRKTWPNKTDDQIIESLGNEVKDKVADGMNKRTQSKISVLVLSGLLSKHSTIDDSMLIKNRRRFNLNRVLHG